MEPAEPFANPVAASSVEAFRPEYLSRLLIRHGSRAFFISTQSIRWIEADDDFVHLHLGGQSHRIRSTLSGLYGRLDPQNFLRIHRSAVVNVNHITEVRIQPKSEYLLVLRDGTTLKLSRNFRTALQRLGGMFGVPQSHVR